MLCDSLELWDRMQGRFKREGTVIPVVDPC